MSDNEKYQHLLKALAELIDSKNKRIGYLEYEVKDLKQQLETLEKKK